MKHVSCLFFIILALSSCEYNLEAFQTYYVAPGGSDSDSGTIDAPWATFTHAVGELTPGDTLYVREGTYSERLIPTVSGKAGNVITIAALPRETPVIDGTSISENGWWYGLIHLNNLEYVTIEGFKVMNAGGQGIQANDCAHIIIRGNTTDTSVSSGIMTWGDSDVSIIDNTVIAACTGVEGYQECISVSETNIFNVSGNTVYNGFMEGIDVKDGASNGVISGNEIYDLTRLGIYIDAWDSLTEDIDVYDNIVYRCSEGIRVNSENGGLVRNVRVYGNLAYDNTECGYWVGVGGIGDSHPVDYVTFDSNIARGNGMDGIRISVPTGGYTDHIRIENNLIYQNERAGIMVADFSGDGSGRVGEVEIVNNTVYGNGTVGGWGAGGIMLNSSTVGQNITVQNNIVSENIEFSILVTTEAVGSVTIDRNLIYGFRSTVEETKGLNVIEADPLFSNASVGDFRLTASSPCINTGIAALSPSHDYAGTIRPKSSGVDIGAYESF